MTAGTAETSSVRAPSANSPIDHGPLGTFPAPNHGVGHHLGLLAVARAIGLGLKLRRHCVGHVDVGELLRGRLRTPHAGPLLGDHAADGGEQSGGSRIGPQHLGQLHRGLDHVVVERPPSPGHAPGHGQVPAQVDAQLQRLGAHRNREARVQIHVIGLVGGQARVVGHRPARVGEARAAVEFGPLGHRHHVVGLGRGPREHPPIRGDAHCPGGPGRAEDQRSGLIHVPLGVVPLGVGPGQHPITVFGSGDGRGAQPVAEPGVGVGRGHLGEAGPQPGHLVAVLFDRLAVGESAGVLDHGVVVGGHHQSGIDLRPADDHSVGGDEVVGLGPSLVGVGGVNASDRRPQPPVLGLPAHHGDHIGRP